MQIKHFRWLIAGCCLGMTGSVEAQSIKLRTQAHDPYGFPRPGVGHQHVPLKTSYYIELGPAGPDSEDAPLAESVAMELKPETGETIQVVTPGPRWGVGYSGRISTRVAEQDQKVLVIYVDSEKPLRPSTTYTIRLLARSQKGAELPAKNGTWNFATEAEPVTHKLDMAVDVRAATIRWSGAFFSGFCKPSFCTSDPYLIGSYELMAQCRQRFPGAWRLQRDFWMTGMDDRPGFLPPVLPNIVRERQTRRIVGMEDRDKGTLLRIEDFFGHEQYGIPSNRPVSEDYHPGDEVLIADGVHDARVKVLAAEDKAMTVLVTPVATPKGGWAIQYAATLPVREDPMTPGMFAFGGCHLIKFRPSGTPCYYWERLDKEFDIIHRRFGRRLSPNFADAPGDLSIDGRNWTTAKDYVQLHEVVRVITDHLIQRYGRAGLDFVWSVFNEPDLGGLFWRTDWNELQKFYDYTTDAILRAFEDRGFDSRQVFIGGLELAGIFGTHLRIEDFLTHCSPRAQGKNALPLNEAFADSRLKGKRSVRVEQLCQAHQGKGAPCDFVSVHAYNRSEMMAAKLKRAKEIALEIDPEYYEKLWVNSHESCPSWNPHPDPAASDSFLGNGYYPSWCADVVRRQLEQASRDGRYSYGETILTIWPYPDDNFNSLNNLTRQISVDDDGDGRPDRKVLLSKPILHFAGLLASMGNNYLTLPVKQFEGYIVSGFATRQEREIRILVYAHDAADTQSRSDRAFTMTLDVAGVPWPRIIADEYRFDRDHNSYYQKGRQLRDRAWRSASAHSAETAAAVQLIESRDPESQRKGFQQLIALGPAAQSALQVAFKCVDGIGDEEIRELGKKAIQRISPQGECYTADEVAQVQDLAELRASSPVNIAVEVGHPLKLKTTLASNGACLLVIRPE